MMRRDNGTLRESLIQMVWRALERLPRERELVLLTFWSSHGGGKTTLLSAVRDTLGSITDITVLGLWDVSHTDCSHLAQEILASAESAPGGCKKIVLLDNLDALLREDEGAAFFAFERELIHRLIERGDTLVVTTSQSALRQWREYDVRVRQENHQILPLAPGEVKQLAEEWRLDPEQAFTLTLGHPQALHWLHSEPDLSEQEIAQKAGRYFLEGLSQEARELAEVASLFLLFNVAVLRLVLSSEGQVETEGLYASYLDGIRGLASTGLLLWDVEVGAYRFPDSAVRRLLARSLYHRHPNEFYRIHGIAGEYYQAEARRAAYLHHNLVSALYHLAQTHRLEELEAMRKKCIKWVEENLDTWVGADWEAVVWAWQTGVGDEAVKGELEELIGSEAFVQIAQLLETTGQSQSMEVIA